MLIRAHETCILRTHERETKVWEMLHRGGGVSQNSSDGHRGPRILGERNSMKEIQGSANTGYKASTTKEERFPQLSLFQ